MAEKVKVFISWSGELSKRLGKAVGDWLEDTLQFVEPFFTPDDVEKGTKWLSEILAKLEACDLGIICLTRENLNSPWILFEAGALSKKERSRVCTLLFDVPKADVRFPLAIFQATEFAKDDLKGLVETINKRGGEFALSEPRLARAFDKCWPELEKEVNAIRAVPKPVDKSTHRSTDEMVAEILELTRSMARERKEEVRELLTKTAVSSYFQKIIQEQLKNELERRNVVTLSDNVVAEVRDEPNSLTTTQAEGADGLERAVQSILDYFGKKKGWHLLRIDRVGPAELQVAFKADAGMRNRDVEETLVGAIRRECGVGVCFVCVE